MAKFTKMAYDSADDMLFGHAKKPVSYGLGIKVGAGRVIPELNYAPRPGTEKSIERIMLHESQADDLTRFSERWCMAVVSSYRKAFS